MKTLRLTQKGMLLPLPRDYVHELSLIAHLAFEVCRAGKGDSHQFYQLIRATYLSFLLWQAGYGRATYELYFDAERALEQAAEHAYASGRWSLNGDAIRALLKITSIYDGQLDSVSGRHYVRIHAELERLLRIDIPRKLETSPRSH